MPDGGHIPGRVDIADRPSVVEEKSRIGDWELDTIVGARHRGALVSSVERGSKFTFLERVDVKTAAAVTAAVTRRMGPIRDRGPYLHGGQRQGVRGAPGDL